MTEELSKTCLNCYEMFDGEFPIAFMGVMPKPVSSGLREFSCSRLVVLPDYQGIGIGSKFLESIAKIYHSKTSRFSIVTSSKNLIVGLQKNQKWRFRRYSLNNLNHLNRLNSLNRCLRKVKTASFVYKGE